jgi:hypothetical protein
LFVGVDSGMSHLCHSVGLPIFLLEYGLPTATVHSGKAHTLCKGYDDFVQRFDHFIGYLHDVGFPDAQGLSEAGQNVATSDADGTSRSENVQDQGAPFSEPDTQHPMPDQASLRRTLSLLTPCAVVGASKVRIGGKNDGGYVMIDDLQGVRFCYSFGVGFDVSWDADMADRGATIFQYDHTVERPCQQHASFHFCRLAIAATDGSTMRTIQTLLEENEHASETDMILKIDIEGAEWDVFDQASAHTLSHFKQIVCEFHGLTGVRDPRWCERAERVLLRLASTHAPVHVHANNFGAFNILLGVPIPDVLEVTYARRSSYSFKSSEQCFPTELDRPNCPDVPDIYLGTFKF